MRVVVVDIFIYTICIIWLKFFLSVKARFICVYAVSKLRRAHIHLYYITTQKHMKKAPSVEKLNSLIRDRIYGKRAYIYKTTHVVIVNIYKDMNAQRIWASFAVYTVTLSKHIAAAAAHTRNDVGVTQSLYFILFAFATPPPRRHPRDGRKHPARERTTRKKYPGKDINFHGGEGGGMMRVEFLIYTNYYKLYIVKQTTTTCARISFPFSIF